jgi:hypothetical protein
MFKKYLTIFCRCLLVFVVGLVGTFVVVFGQVENSRVPSALEMRAPLPISDAYAVSEKKAIRKSSESAVRVLSWAPTVGNVSIASGTYFEHYGHYYVITVHHGLLTPTCELIQIETDGLVANCETIVALNASADYAILQVAGITNRTPLRFPRDFVRTYRGWRQTVSVLHPLIYTGYPNTIGPVTLAGKIMGVSPEEFIYLNSYAWSGSSGSGVFNMDGKFVGYIMAIDVGQTEYGFDVLENVILVVPHYQVDWSPVIKRKFDK